MSEIKGIEQFRQRLGGIREELLDRAGRALYQEALIMSADSQERTPVKTGALRGSHEVTEPEREGDTVRVTLRVGGPAAPYAYFVHENLETDHNASHRDPSDGKDYTCGGEAKFLESAVREGSEGLGSRLAERMKE